METYGSGEGRCIYHLERILSSILEYLDGGQVLWELKKPFDYSDAFIFSGTQIAVCACLIMRLN